ncbi:MAG: hypothetical protein JWP55_5013, partial [Mycobacterium sp.]|nr:hypothetical protein [Mycobacterium sp.]
AKRWLSMTPHSECRLVNDDATPIANSTNVTSAHTPTTS